MLFIIKNKNAKKKLNKLKRKKINIANNFHFLFLFLREIMKINKNTLLHSLLLLLNTFIC